MRVSELVKKNVISLHCTFLKKRGLSLLFGVTISNFIAAQEVNVYSSRQPFMIKPVLEDFSEQTGIVVNIVYSKKDMVKQLTREGSLSAADLVLTSDVAPLYEMAQRGLTQKVESELLDNNIPQKYRDPQGLWFAITARSRILYVAKDRVLANEIQDYEDLMSEKWHARICTRSLKHNYMLSLVSAMILARGESYTQTWLSGIKRNLARKPQGNDRAQVKAISEGICDVAFVNSYYFAKMITNKRKPEQVEWAKSVNLVFPNQSNRGSHMNISGIALTKHAPHKENAIKLMEYLSSNRAQYIYAQQNHEFPVKLGIQHSKLLKQYMPKFKQDEAALADVAKLHNKALAIIERVDIQ